MRSLHALAVPLLLLASTAVAAPPSSTLTGTDGTLSWQISTSGDTVSVQGSSPKWTVTHTADTDLTPRRTTRTNPDGTVVEVTYRPDGVVVKMPDGKTREHAGKGIWDGDTLDVRLGHLVATHQTLDRSFKAVDTGSGKLYGFDVVDEGAESCRKGPCRHVNVSLSGWLKVVGPSFDYWFAADGRLVKFEGPAGDFAAR